MADIKRITPHKILWVDLEMTGLDPKTHRIIEAAAIITDWDFKELATFETVVQQSSEVINESSEFARIQHEQSGLIDKVPLGLPEAEAEQKLCDVVRKQFGDEPALLAGNSIHMDRQFIRAWWPKLEGLLHYRMLDVSAWKVVMQGKYNIGYEKKEAHRALDDIRESIDELKFYLKKLK